MFAGRGGKVILELGEFAAVARGEDVGAGGEHLAEFHEGWAEGGEVPAESRGAVLDVPALDVHARAPTSPRRSAISSARRSTNAGRQAKYSSNAEGSYAGDAVGEARASDERRADDDVASHGGGGAVAEPTAETHAETRTRGGRERRAGPTLRERRAKPRAERGHLALVIPRESAGDDDDDADEEDAALGEEANEPLDDADARARSGDRREGNAASESATNLRIASLRPVLAAPAPVPGKRGGGSSSWLATSSQNLHAERRPGARAG